MGVANYQHFMNANVNKHLGRWIAIDNEKIIASHEDFKVVFKEAKKLNPKKRPFIARVNEKGTMIF